MQLQQQTTRRPTTNVSPVKGQKNSKLSSTVMGNLTSLLLAAQWQPQAEHSSAIRAVRQFKSLDSRARTSLFDEELEHHVWNVVSEVQHAFVHASTKEITWTAHYIFFLLLLSLSSKAVPRWRRPWLPHTQPPAIPPTNGGSLFLGRFEDGHISSRQKWIVLQQFPCSLFSNHAIPAFITVVCFCLCRVSLQHAEQVNCSCFFFISLDAHSPAIWDAMNSACIVLPEATDNDVLWTLFILENSATHRAGDVTCILGKHCVSTLPQ